MDLDSGRTLKILITGHTGFKGAWLGALLKSQGHELAGLSLDARPDSLFNRGNLRRLYNFHGVGDVSDFDMVRDVFERVQPDRIFHLAAQPLVRYSYLNPRETFTTNVDGTLNVLEASKDVLSHQSSVVVVTTDKVYKDQGNLLGYDETSPLGGVDPYSASKAMADLLTQSWIACNPDFRGAVARAGNVIGGGDDSAERLLPDLIRSHENGQTPMLRNPNAVRPWQHVLDCLNGYWKLSERLDQVPNRGAWNFGPPSDSFAEVKSVADLVGDMYGSDKKWTHLNEVQPHETAFLTLNSEKARRELGWENSMALEQAIAMTVSWHQAVASGKDPYDETLKQVINFLDLQA